MNPNSSIHRRDFLARAGAGIAAASGGLESRAFALQKASPAPVELPALTIRQQPVANMLSREVFVTLRRLHMRQAMTNAGCPRARNHQGYHRALADLCHVLLSSNGFIHID